MQQPSLAGPQGLSLWDLSFLIHSPGGTNEVYSRHTKGCVCVCLVWEGESASHTIPPKLGFKQTQQDQLVLQTQQDQLVLGGGI